MIVKIYSEYIVDPQMKRDISGVELEEVIFDSLAHGLAHELVKHIEEIDYKTEIITRGLYLGPAEKHQIKINIISDEELKRLKAIELKYNLHDYTNWGH